MSGGKAPQGSGRRGGQVKTKVGRTRSSDSPDHHRPPKRLLPKSAQPAAAAAGRPAAPDDPGPRQPHTNGLAHVPYSLDSVGISWVAS